MGIREFSRLDGVGYGGARPMSDGAGPLIGEVSIGGQEYTLIVGGCPTDDNANRITVLGEEEGDEPCLFTKTFSGDAPSSVREIAYQLSCSCPPSFGTLLELGFVRVP